MWNIVGLQGAVLTHFMEPVYFDTVIIGGCFSLYHITRALVNRYFNFLSVFRIVFNIFNRLFVYYII